MRILFDQGTPEPLIPFLAGNQGEGYLTAKLEEPHHCDCGSRQFAVADRAALRSENSGQRECSDAAQLR